MAHSNVCVAILTLVSLNYFIECGSKRQTVCLNELDTFSVPKATSGASSDARPEVCSTVFGCCNKTIEDAMRTHISEKLMNITHGRNEHVKQQLKDAYDDLEGVLREVLQLTAGSAIDSLQTYSKSKIAEDATPHINSLFEDLQTAVASTDLRVDNSSTTFFRDFYPLVHQHIVAKKKLPVDFAKCLKDNMHVILPFADVPRKVTKMLTKKLRPVQAFLRSLQTLGLVLDAIDNVDLSQECISALVKMYHCPLCDGLSDVKPCLAYCADVVSSCLEPYNDTEDKWSSFLIKLEKFRTHLAMSLDASVLFERLQELISESMSHASHSTVAAQVLKHCGNMTDYQGNDIISIRPVKQTGIRDIGNGDLYLVDQNPKFQRLPTLSDISKRLMFLRNNLSSMRIHMKMIHINICSNDGLSAPATDNDNCWVGNGLGRYEGAMKDVALSPVNSEMIVGDVLLLLRKASEEISQVKFSPWKEEDGSGWSSDRGSASGEGSGGSGEPTDESSHSGADCSDDDDEDNCILSSGYDKFNTGEPTKDYEYEDNERTQESIVTKVPDSGASTSYVMQASLLGLLLLYFVFSR